MPTGSIFFTYIFFFPMFLIRTKYLFKWPPGLILLRIFFSCCWYVHFNICYDILKKLFQHKSLNIKYLFGHIVNILVTVTMHIHIAYINYDKYIQCTYVYNSRPKVPSPRTLSYILCLRFVKLFNWSCAQIWLAGFLSVYFRVAFWHCVIISPHPQGQFWVWTVTVCSQRSIDELGRRQLIEYCEFLDNNQCRVNICCRNLDYSKNYWYMYLWRLMMSKFFTFWIIFGMFFLPNRQFREQTSVVEYQDST